MKSNLQRKVMRLGAVLLVLGALGACCGPWGPGPGPGGGGHGGPGGPGHLQQPGSADAPVGPSIPSALMPMGDRNVSRWGRSGFFMLKGRVSGAAGRRNKTKINATAPR